MYPNVQNNWRSPTARRWIQFQQLLPLATPSPSPPPPLHHNPFIISVEWLVAPQCLEPQLHQRPYRQMLTTVACNLEALHISEQQQSCISNRDTPPPAQSPQYDIPGLCPWLTRYDASIPAPQTVLKLRLMYWQFANLHAFMWTATPR